MLKYFTYQFVHSEFSGYKLLDEKNIFSSFTRIVYNGFRILYNDSQIIHFEIDTQLIRRLKLKKLSDEVSVNSAEDKLLSLLERSKEKEDNLLPFTQYSYQTMYWYNFDDIKLIESLNKKIEKRERNKFLVTQSKMNNRKIKQYENKGRFRK